MPIIISLITFAVVLSVTLLLWRYANRTPQAAKRINQYLAGDRKASQVSRPVAAPKKPMTNVWGLIRTLSRHLEGPQWSKLLENKLIQAGLPLRGSEFTVICAGMAVIAVMLALLAGSSLLTAMCLAGIAGIVLPLLMIRVKAQRRLKMFNTQMGDALILIANSLRTGYSFLQAIEMVSREMPPPISVEFARLLKEMNLGVVAEDALNNMAKRMDSDDLDLVVTAVVIQRQVGGNLAEILDNIALTIRERVKIKGEIRTLTAQGRISGIIICALPICLGIIIHFINPEYMHVLFTHPLGKMMLVGGVVSQIFGILMIRRIVNIDV